MDFTLTREQRMVRDLARSFAKEEIAPLAATLDRTSEFPRESIRKMGEMGLRGMIVPEEYGGGGTDTISYSLAVEEISRACASTGVIMSVHTSVCCYPILKFGTEQQKHKYLPRLVTGTYLGAFALTEPGAGSDAASQQTVAVRDGDEYVLNGSKIFITNGVGEGVVVVAALTDRSAGTRGISTFIVEKGTPGFTLGSKENKMGINASDTYELVFEECRVPAQNMLGPEGGGFKVAMASLDGGRVSIAAQAVGIAQACLDESLKYAREREQFGRPIGKFQAIQWMLADMATGIEAARCLVLKASDNKDRGHRFTTESAMAKVYAGGVANSCARKGLQIHGGYGFTKDYPIERLYRDARITEIYEGTSEIQRLVIANDLLR
jgi:butyryl-CoA dehydrogenase